MSWKAIAEALASRLKFHAPCDAHDKPEPSSCPFCADADAMRLYREKKASSS